MGVRQFFCEGCGKPVPRDVDVCPFCGKTFKAVRCPACGFSGDAKLFSDGCPSCGYLADRKPPPERSDQKPSKRKRGLPPWAFTLITLFLAAVLIVLIYIFFSL